MFRVCQSVPQRRGQQLLWAQTIALLAVLASEKGLWGPHLIVVPTSVLLNWDMEFKKFAPAFKVVTYYGSPKERKAKRLGWSKPNAFHVCITSYNLALLARSRPLGLHPFALHALLLLAQACAAGALAAPALQVGSGCMLWCTLGWIHFLAVCVCA
jgi:SNF2-related domain